MQTLERTAAALSMPTETSDALAPGVLAGPWRVERELGRGGMGAVYAVVHTEIGKQAALKVVHRKVASPGARMMLEAQVVNRVGHPNIVDIFEVGHLPDGRAYLVMERLEGQSLSHRADDGKLFPDQVIGILLQICDALIAAHAAGIIHRDLKLDNVFLTDNPDEPMIPRVKLLDWGIAKILDEQLSPSCTIDGQLVGTPQYLSPEQARGAPVSPKTDVYSLGVMAYELFLEQLPFEAETAAEIMTMHLRATPPPASDTWPEIPTVLEDLIHQMLAKNAVHRPSMLEVARQLEVVRGILRQPPGARTPQSIAITSPAIELDVPAPRRRWQWIVGAAATATCAVLFLLVHLVDPAAVTSNASASVIGAPSALGVRLTTTAVEMQPATPALEPVPPVAAPIAAPVATKPAPRPIVRRAIDRPVKSTPTNRRNAKVDPDGTFDPY